MLAYRNQALHFACKFPRSHHLDLKHLYAGLEFGNTPAKGKWLFQVHCRWGRGDLNPGQMEISPAKPHFLIEYMQSVKSDFYKELSGVNARVS